MSKDMVEALRDLRLELERLQRLYDADEFERLFELSEDEATIDRLTELVHRADRLVSGKAVTHPLGWNAAHADYAYHNRSHVAGFVAGEPWLWHLLDGGYSRITIDLTKPALMWLDRGLSSSHAIQMWDHLNGGIETPMNKQRWVSAMSHT